MIEILFIICGFVIFIFWLKNNEGFDNKLPPFPGYALKFDAIEGSYGIANNILIPSHDFIFVGQFRTHVPQGIIFVLHGQKTPTDFAYFLSICLSQGKLYIHIRFNNSTFSSLLISDNVNDNKLHQIICAVTPETPNFIEVIFDNKKMQFEINNALSQVLGTSMFVGGIPFNLDVFQLHNFAGNFLGCIGNVLLYSNKILRANLKNFVYSKAVEKCV